MSRTRAIERQIILVFATLAASALWPEDDGPTLNGMKKPTSFDEAFQVLDRAINDIDEPKLRPLVDGEIQHIRSDVRESLHSKALTAQRRAKELAQVAQDLGALGRGHVSELAERLDEDVRENPLLYIGGAAAAALLIGIIVAPRSNRTEVYV